MIPTKELATEYLKKQGYDAEIDKGVVTVYGAQFNTIQDELKGIGYNASFGVKGKRDGREY